MASKDVGNLRTRLSWEDDGASRSIKDFSRDLRGLKSEMSEVRSRGEKYASSLKGLRQQQDILNRKHKTQEEHLKTLKKRYDETRKTKGENAARTKYLAEEYNKARASMNRTEQQLEDLTKSIENQTNPMKRLGNNLDATGQKFQSVGQGMMTFGRSATMGVTTPIAGIAGAAIKVASDFEESMSKVQAVSGATGEEMEKLESQARDMGESTRFSARETAGAQEYLARAGFEVNEVLGAMPGLLDLASAAQMDLATASDITSNIMSGFEIEASKASEVSDVLAYSSSNANTDVNQMGQAMAYAAPIANNLGVSVEETAAAIGFMSDAGIQGSKAGTALRGGLTRLMNPTGRAKSTMEELGVELFNSEGNMKSLDEVISELQGSMKDYDEEAKNVALSNIFGQEASAGWLAVMNRGSDDLGEFTKELENSEGSAREMADTMNDNTNGSMREFRSSLESAGIAAADHLLPVFNDIVDYTTEMIHKFGELDEEQQKQILKWAGIAAAVGPASVALGGITTAVGGIMRVGGGLLSLLGKAGGRGLIARIGMMGMGGPVGLAVGGVTALGTAVYALTRDKEKALDINFDYIESMKEEVNQTEDLISRFEELERANRLSKDEMVEYMDILDQIKDAKSEDKIAELRDRQSELLEKSTLTNGEMEEFIELNDNIIDQAPDAAGAISEEGNAYADNLETLKELNDAKREELRMETQRELAEALQEENRLKEEQQELEEEIKSASQERKRLQQDYVDQIKVVNDLESDKRDLYADLRELEKDGLSTGDKRFDQVVAELDKTQENLNKERDKEQSLKDQLNAQEDIIETKQGDLEETNKQLDKIDRLKNEYEQIVLSNFDINAAKGEGLQKIEDEIGRLKTQRDELSKNASASYKLTDDYQNQVDKINDQIGNLQTAKGHLKDMNDLASNTPYEPNVNLAINPSIHKFRSRLTLPLGVNIEPQIKGLWEFRQRLTLPLKTPIQPTYNGLSYAEGTDSHPGGPALVGEEGWELTRVGNQWSALNAGVYDLPRGTEVFTHQESKRMIDAMNNFPAYASGASAPGEANRVVNQLNNQSMQGEAVVYTTVINQIDGREVGRQTHKHITEFQNREQRVRGEFA
ncbi:phage tail tape measure protein [Alkalibacillus salilacus]|uniref:TP901 family phage tail tape measure protein n=1 Tax=Alkalibacillus salilacus TaxID=284582 RepID=A0ABT9VDF3_9BACI|nr:phage tail tape measure protein [Alkalibacillus salilacus]MDQ0158957.1 TP901 family phage tail tape measure protein [Alkalibacillus salilacus]